MKWPWKRRVSEPAGVPAHGRVTTPEPEPEPDSERLTDEQIRTAIVNCAHEAAQEMTAAIVMHTGRFVHVACPKPEDWDITIGEEANRG